MPLVGMRAFRATMRTLSWWEAFRRSKDPPTFIVVFEDSAAILGIVAAAAGTARVGYDPKGAGLYVLVVVDAHARVFYCHLSSVSVTDRQAVSAGQVLGAIGESGLATGPHLHFEVQVDGRAIDPVAWLAS